MKLSIKGIQKTSLIDYPGKVASIIFFGGCNFLCPFCHNPELVEGYEEFDDITPEEILAFLSDRKMWIDGVCLSGGEPTIYQDLVSFCAEIKKRGFLIKLDTNGTGVNVLEKLIDGNLVDFIAMDIKHSPEKYYQAVGLDKDKTTNIIESVKKAVQLIKKSAVEYEFRTTVVPKLHSADDVYAIARWLEGSSLFILQQFRPGKTLNPDYSGRETFEPGILQDMKKKIEPFFGKCDVRLNV